MTVDQMMQELNEQERVAQAVEAEREACALIADNAAVECLRHARHPEATCEHPECCEQRSMAKACRSIANMIRARGKESQK